MSAELEDGTRSIRLRVDSAENRIHRLRCLSALHHERVRHLKRRAGARCAAPKLCTVVQKLISTSKTCRTRHAAYSTRLSFHWAQRCTGLPSIQYVTIAHLVRTSRMIRYNWWPCRTRRCQCFKTAGSPSSLQYCCTVKGST